MSITQPERLRDRWTTDPVFRDERRREPGTIIGAGHDLDETEWAAADQADWSRPAAERRSRVTDPSACPPA